MQTISQKSKEILFKTVSDEIMDARIKIQSLPVNNKSLSDQIDIILSKLNRSAPQKAIDCFKHHDK